jgi:TPR repeat protein
VLTPNSARSPICDWEVEEATRLNKRILPVVCRPLEGVGPPPRLRELNYIFFYKEPKVSGSGFGTGLASLVAALNTDFDWLREHTRYLQRAMEWDAGGRPTDRLLSGNDILEAKAWAARRPKSAPEPTALQLDFIRASEVEAETRLSEQRKQLEAVAAAQAAREKALHEAEEALKQAADAQRKRARIRNFALVVVSVLAVLAGWLGWSAEEQRKLAEQQRATAEEQRRLAEQQRMTAEQQRQQADRILGRATTIIANLQGMMDNKTKQAAFALLRAGAEHGDVNSIKNLGVAYAFGFGVPQDYFKAREWYEKAAAKDNASAMYNLGIFYANGQGAARDYVKAREWFEKAATQGDAKAKMALERLPSEEAQAAGRYDEALRLEEALAAKVEAEETKRDGRPGTETALELSALTWAALLAKEFSKALTVADRAHALLPDSLAIDATRADALMFMGHDEEAKAVYLAHKGEGIKENNWVWEQNVAEEFAQFRKAGLTHPMMADVEKKLGISR